MKSKITLMIDEATWREFRAQALRSGANASSEVEKFMRAELQRATNTDRPASRIVEAPPNT